MAEYQAGSLKAFDQLHDNLASDLKAYLTRLSRDATRAEDLLQDTFLQLHRARASHTPGQSVRPWVFAIAKRVFLMDHRSRARRARYERIAVEDRDDATNVRRDAQRLEAREQVACALRRVPLKRRRAFVLHHLFGLSFKEIGARLGINAGAAKLRSSRAASLMRTWLREDPDD